MARHIKRKNKGETINRDNLLSMLRQCYLGGALEECVLDIEDGVGKIRAIDITNTVTIYLEGDVGKKDDAELGLGNIDLLIKFLASMEDNKVAVSIDKKGQHLEITNKNKQRTLKYLLTTPDVIVTRMEFKKKRDPFKKLEGKMKYELKLNEKTIHDFLSYSSMLKEKGTIVRLLEVDGKKELSIIYGNANEHQFQIILDKDYDDSGDDEFDIYINGEFISKILSVIEYDEGDAPTLLFTSATMPILIKNKEALWFVTPITDVPF